MFEEDQQRRRIRAGLASPKFTAARQHIEQNFHPPRDIVSNESGMQSLLHSLTAGPPRGGDVPRGEDASQARSAYSSEINDPTAGGEPRGDGREVEIRVVILRDGSVGPSKIKIRSGSPRFNEMALQAVLAAAARVGPPEEGCDVVTRWSVTAAVRMGSLQRLGGVFEETTGAVSGKYPAARDVKVSVAFRLPFADGTAPADWVEGEDQADTLDPPSLYEDQLRRRLKR